MQIRDWPHCMEIIKILEEGGKTDNPEVRIKCEIAWDTGEISLVQEILNDYPGIYEEALRNIEEKDYWEEQEPYRPYPEGEDLEQIQGDIPLGIINPYKDKFGLKLTDLPGHMGIYGRPGTGKTTLMNGILESLLSMPNREFNIIIFDVKRDYQHLIKKYPSLIALRKKHLRYAHFEVHEAQTKEDIEEGMKDDIRVLTDVLYFGATGQPIIESALLDLFKEKGVYEGSGRWPKFSDVRYKIQNMKNLSGPRTQDVLTHINVRFDQFIKTGDVFNCARGYPLSFWRENDIVIDMQGMNEFERPIFANGLAMKIFKHNMSRDLRGNKPRTIFYFDEGYNFFDADMDKGDYASNKTIKTLFRMAREFGLCFIVSAQQITSVSRYIRENTGTIICFRTQDQSLLEIQKNMGLSDAQTEYIYKLAPRFEGIIRLPNFERPLQFWMEVDLFPKKDVTIEEIDARAKLMIEKLQEEIQEMEEEEPIKPYTEEDLEQIRKIIYSDTWQLLEILQKKPFMYRTELLKAAGVNQTKFTKSMDWLKKESFIEEMLCKVSTKDATFYPLTEKAHDLLKTPIEKRKPHPKRFKHTYYCERVKFLLEQQGIKAIREYGSGDDRIDVYAEHEGKKTAYEITLSLRNLEHNILKCFVKFNVDELCIVCESLAEAKNVKERILKTEKIPEEAKEAIMDKIRYEAMNKFKQS